jgi:hypothetical protein
MTFALGTFDKINQQEIQESFIYSGKEINNKEDLQKRINQDLERINQIGQQHLVSWERRLLPPFELRTVENVLVDKKLEFCEKLRDDKTLKAYDLEVQRIVFNASQDSLEIEFAWRIEGFAILYFMKLKNLSKEPIELFLNRLKEGVGAFYLERKLSGKTPYSITVKLANGIIYYHLTRKIGKCLTFETSIEERLDAKDPIFDLQHSRVKYGRLIQLANQQLTADAPISVEPAPTDEIKLPTDEFKLT